MRSDMPARAGRCDDRFEQERAAIEPNFFHFDDGFRYAERVLFDNPRAGKESDTPGVWVVTLRYRGSDENTIRFSVFYGFDDAYVTFLSIKKHG